MSSWPKVAKPKLRHRLNYIHVDLSSLLTLSLSLSLSLSLFQRLVHTHTHPHTLSLSLSLRLKDSLSLSHTHTHTYSLSLPLKHFLSFTLSHSRSFLIGEKKRIRDWLDSSEECFVAFMPGGDYASESTNTLFLRPIDETIDGLRWHFAEEAII